MKKVFNLNYWYNQNKHQQDKQLFKESCNSTNANPLRHASTHDDLLAVAEEIVRRDIDLTAGYDNWLRLGFALADGLGEQGRELFHRLSRMNAQYNPAECDKQYAHCLRSAKGGITINSFFYMAKQAGVEIGKRADDMANFDNFDTLTLCQNKEKIEKQSIFNNNTQLGQDVKVSKLSKLSNSAYTFSDKLQTESLCPFLAAILAETTGEPAKRDAMMLAALNVVSGLMGGANGKPSQRAGIYGIYDGRRAYAPIYNIIYSGAGNDKGTLSFAKLLAHPVKAMMRKRYEAERAQYEADMLLWETKKKRERGDAPKEPAYRDPFVPGNSSSSAVYRAMEANGGWGMMFETEADTVSAMLQSDYGNYSDLMRKAHHHEPLSMNRVTEKLHIDIEEPRLSIFLTCTPGQLPALFPSFENGLGSRFLFYHIPDEDVDFHNVFAHHEAPLDEAYRTLGDTLLPLYEAMRARAGRPLQFFMSSRQQKEFLDTYADMLSQQFAMLGKGIRPFILRIALECFRYAMVLTALRRLGEWQQAGVQSAPIFSDDENALECSDADFQTATTIIACLIQHTARVYAVMAKETDDDPFAQNGIKLTKSEQRVYDALPDEEEFRSAIADTIAQHLGVSARTVHRALGALCNKHGIVVPVRYGVYRKL